MREGKKKMPEPREKVGFDLISFEEAIKRIRKTYPNPEIVEKAINAERQRKKERLEAFVKKLNDKANLSRRFALRPAETLHALVLLGDYDSFQLDYDYGALKKAEVHSRLEDLRLDSKLLGDIGLFLHWCYECRWEALIDCSKIWWPDPHYFIPDHWGPRVICRYTFRLLCFRHHLAVRCVTVCVKVLEGADDSHLQDDVDEANEIYAQCGIEIRLGNVETNHHDDLLDLDRDDCSLPPNHTVSAEEQELYELLREDCPNEVVAYYIRSDINGALGCAAHPEGLDGFTVTNGQPDRLTFAHELGHVLGLLHNNIVGNIMNNSANIGTGLTEDQCETIRSSALVRWCC
jgi:hypothetical protein